MSTILPPLFGYEPPPSDALRDHARALYDRRLEMVTVPVVDVGTEAWRPLPQDCHGNCEAWCERNPEYQLVRGWIFLPLPGLAYSRFLSHSVVRQPDDLLIDITPRGQLREAAPYSFIATIVSNDEYEALVVDLYEASGTGFLDHQHTAA
ncbi:hypothetical protein [Paraburkholderia sp. 22B1P]|uniref:hypothetical protein n=1 Tax=Paraburkholderia sp. 22B1P TaxID=3080498 RepID=UPI003089F382|nr:hypothetical protein PBP221_85010 [Paraburkholderia sp. 22B1P]